MLLNGLVTNSQVLHDIQPELDNILSADSVRQVDAATNSIAGVTNIFGALGPVGASLTWLAIAQ